VYLGIYFHRYSLSACMITMSFPSGHILLLYPWAMLESDSNCPKVSKDCRNRVYRSSCKVTSLSLLRSQQPRQQTYLRNSFSFKWQVRDSEYSHPCLSKSLIVILRLWLFLSVSLTRPNKIAIQLSGRIKLCWFSSCLVLKTERMKKYLGLGM
jgi:hypothetical protein